MELGDGFHPWYSDLTINIRTNHVSIFEKWGCSCIHVFGFVWIWIDYFFLSWFSRKDMLLFSDRSCHMEHVCVNSIILWFSFGIENWLVYCTHILFHYEWLIFFHNIVKHDLSVYFWILYSSVWIHIYICLVGNSQKIRNIKFNTTYVEF